MEQFFDSLDNDRKVLFLLHYEKQKETWPKRAARQIGTSDVGVASALNRLVRLDPPFVSFRQAGATNLYRITDDGEAYLKKNFFDKLPNLEGFLASYLEAYLNRDDERSEFGTKIVVPVRNAAIRLDANRDMRINGIL